MLKEKLLGSLLKTQRGRNVSTKIGKTNTTLNTYAPEILLTAGIGLGVISAILLVRAGRRHEATLGQLSDDLHDTVEEAMDIVASDAPEEDKSQTIEEIGRNAVTYGWEATKLYAPGVGVGLLSIVLILKSHGVMKGRNDALIALVGVLEQSFMAYRGRVASVIGEDEEEELYYGLGRRTVRTKTVDEDGKKHTSKHIEIVLPDDINDPELNARLFDEGNPNWKPNRSVNGFFLAAKERYWNDILHLNGHVTLNDVYKSLNMRDTPEGAIVGWSLLAEQGDDYIDFGLSKPANATQSETETRWLLTFNTNGIIFQHI